MSWGLVWSVWEESNEFWKSLESNTQRNSKLFVQFRQSRTVRPLERGLSASDFMVSAQNLYRTVRAQKFQLQTVRLMDRRLSAHRVLTQNRPDGIRPSPHTSSIKSELSLSLSLNRVSTRKKKEGDQGIGGFPEHSEEFPGHSAISSIMSSRYLNAIFSDLNEFRVWMMLGLIPDLLFEPWIWETFWGKMLLVMSTCYVWSLVENHWLNHEIYGWIDSTALLLFVREQ